MVSVGGTDTSFQESDYFCCLLIVQFSSPYVFKNWLVYIHPESRGKLCLSTAWKVMLGCFIAIGNNSCFLLNASCPFVYVPKTFTGTETESEGN